MEEQEGSEERGRSFRYEEYSNRRVFLRSYPLHYHSHWEEDDEEEAAAGHDNISISNNNNNNTSSISKKIKKVGNADFVKETLVYVVGWSKGKFLLLKKLKRKLSFYIISSCQPFGHSAFKNPSPSLLSV